MESLKKLKWVGDPCGEEKSHGSLISYLSDKEIAKNIIRGHLAFKRTHLQAVSFQLGPIQCFNFLKVGHIASSCKNKPTCIRCGHQHKVREWKEEIDYQHFTRFIKHDMENNKPVDRIYEKYFDSVFSNKCPIKQAKLEKSSTARFS
ncbi:hypothetical protein O181_009310 [Austropuccinia psidii MF-1]|uniref:Uncharacterized protein n=1 Tax=Austropuccinia psidii MF-1 TaxID=1389203 RepID=A0A9Q3BR32_9BASI|nr:hypothetical protein [Austropuccinia psidii MF-1]